MYLLKSLIKCLKPKVYAVVLVFVTFGKANATLSKKKSSLAKGVWLRFEKLTKPQHFKTSF